MCPRSPRCHLPRVIRVPGTVQPVDLVVQSRPEPPRVRDMRKSHFLPCISCFFSPRCSKGFIFFPLWPCLEACGCCVAGDGPSAVGHEGLRAVACGPGAQAQWLRRAGAVSPRRAGPPEPGTDPCLLHEQLHSWPRSLGETLLFPVCSGGSCLSILCICSSSGLCVRPLLFLFLAVPHSLWDLSSLGRD